MRRVMLQMNREATVHGFRTAFRDWAGEQTAFPHDVAEAALAHSRGAVERAYARGDLFIKRRQLMEAWASYFSTPAKASADVVPIEKGELKIQNISPVCLSEASLLRLAFDCRRGYRRRFGAPAVAF